MDDLQCPQCLAKYPNLGLLASHMERDDNISPEWITQWVSIFADQKRKSESPSPSAFNSSTGIDLAVARFRVWFVLDGVTIHRREIPGNEEFEGFCSQLESLYYKPGSRFDVSQFEYVLVAKKRAGTVKAERFKGSSSYLRMRNKLLEDKSPWRHATVRRVLTGLSALESYVRMRPTINSYPPPVPRFTLASPQRCPQDAEAPPIHPSLPIRTISHMPAGSSMLPAQITATPHPPSSFKRSPFRSSTVKWIRPKGPVRDLSQSPIAFKKPSSGVAIRNRNAHGQNLLSPTRGTPRSLLPSPLAHSLGSMGPKRRRVAPSDTAQEYKSLPSSPLARHEASVTEHTARSLSTLTPPITFTDQSAARMATTRQIGQPTQRKRKFIDLSVSTDDRIDNRVQVGRSSVGEGLDEV